MSRSASPYATRSACWIRSTACAKRFAQSYRFFKIKLCGDPAKDRTRLIEHRRRCLATSTIAPPLDANEQYRSLADLATLVESPSRRARRLRPLPAGSSTSNSRSPREDTWNFDLRSARNARSHSSSTKPMTAMTRFRAPKASAIAACRQSHARVFTNRCSTARGPRAGTRRATDFFISAEDLTCQAGLAVQQDNALVAFHGLTTPSAMATIMSMASPIRPLSRPGISGSALRPLRTVGWQRSARGPRRHDRNALARRARICLRPCNQAISDRTTKNTT